VNELTGASKRNPKLSPLYIPLIPSACQKKVCCHPLNSVNIPVVHYCWCQFFPQKKFPTSSVRSYAKCPKVQKNTGNEASASKDRGDCGWENDKLKGRGNENGGERGEVEEHT